MPSIDDHTEESITQEPTYVETFDPAADDQPCEAIVSAVSALLEADPLELSPLYETIETSALDSLFEHANRKASGNHQVWFTYEGIDVGVRSDGRIELIDSSGQASS